MFFVGGRVIGSGFAMTPLYVRVFTGVIVSRKSAFDGVRGMHFRALKS